MSLLRRHAKSRAPHQHPAILPWPSNLPVCGRANDLPSLKSAAASLPVEHADDLASAGWNARTTPRVNDVSGEYPAARSTTCNGLHRFERDNRAADVALEMLGEVGDALRKDCHLHLG